MHAILSCKSFYIHCKNTWHNLNVGSTTYMHDPKNEVSLWLIITARNKCAACYRQFNRLEHLVDHMRTSYHSVHEPTCGICKKHCRSFESLREHLIGKIQDNYMKPEPYCPYEDISFKGSTSCLGQGRCQKWNAQEYSVSADATSA